MLWFLYSGWRGCKEEGDTEGGRGGKLGEMEDKCLFSVHGTFCSFSGQTGSCCSCERFSLPKPVWMHSITIVLSLQGSGDSGPKSWITDSPLQKAGGAGWRRGLKPTFLKWDISAHKRRLTLATLGCSGGREQQDLLYRETPVKGELSNGTLKPKHS